MFRQLTKSFVYGSNSTALYLYQTMANMLILFSEKKKYYGMIC